MEIWQSTVSIIVVIVGAVVWVTSRFNKLERRIDGLEHRIDGVKGRIDEVRDRLGEAISVLGNSVSAILNILETIVAILAKANLIKGEEQVALYKGMASAHALGIDRTIDSVFARTNPFTAQEVARLRLYRNKLVHGEAFSPDQVKDFHELAHKLKEERPEQEGTWYLVALAAFLLGMHAGAKET